MTASLLSNFLQTAKLSCTSNLLQRSHQLLCVQPNDSGKRNTAKSCTEYSQNTCSVVRLMRVNQDRHQNCFQNLEKKARIAKKTSPVVQGAGPGVALQGSLRESPDVVSWVVLGSEFPNLSSWTLILLDLKRRQTLVYSTDKTCAMCGIKITFRD